VIVTKLVYGKKNPDYANLYIDNRFEASVLVESVVSMSLKSGDEITEIDLRALKSEAGWQKWIDKIINYISVRPRSKKEIGDYIKNKLLKYKKLNIDTGLEFAENNDEQNEQTKSLGVANNGDLIESLINYLVERKYINDLDFAVWFIAQRLRGGNPKGLNYIKSELYSKGVTKSDIELAFEKTELDEVLNETEALIKVFNKKIKKYKAETFDNKIQNKLIQYLMGKGFKYADIKLKVDEYKHDI